jgi:hypothetical protein
MNCWNFYGSITCPYDGGVEFGLITVNALLFALDWLVTELEYYFCLKKAESLCEQLDYLEAIAFLDEIRQSPEYRSIRSK